MHAESACLSEATKLALRLAPAIGDMRVLAASTGAACIGAEPRPRLVEQLGPGARLVAPVGRASQHLTLVRRTESGITQATLEGVRFVPLVREEEPGE